MGIEEGFKFKKHTEIKNDSAVCCSRKPQPQQSIQKSPISEIDCEGAFEIHGLEIQSDIKNVKDKHPKKESTTHKPSSSPKLKIPIVNLKEL